MIRTDLLRGKMAEKGYSQSRMADELGITSHSFYNKMKKGVFRSDEIQKMIELLVIEDPISIFFASKVATSQLNK